METKVEVVLSEGPKAIVPIAVEESSESSECEEVEPKIVIMPAPQQPVVNKGIRYFKLQAPVAAELSESSED